MNEMNNPIVPEENISDEALFTELESLSAETGTEETASAETVPAEAAPRQTAPVERKTAPASPAVRRRRRRRKSKRDIRVIISRFFLRVALVLLVTICLILGAAWILLDSIFNGPSEAACELLTMSLYKSSGTWWMPAFFMGEERAAEIIQGDQTFAPIDDVSGKVEIDVNGALNSDSDEWAKYPDGIRIETVYGDTYTAHVMIVRDPSSVCLATSYQYSGGTGFSTSLPGQRITNMMTYTGAIAGINAGAFYDDGTGSSMVGSVPHGLVVSNGNVVWTSGVAPFRGFVGFDKDNKLIVASSMTAAKAKEMNIRDGCEFGPVLIVDGVVNEEIYNKESGVNPRTAIGQRVDGAVIMVCIDGRQAGSLGGSFADMIDIMIEYGAVNACNLDGGSSSVMMYRDSRGLYGNAGDVVMINSYSLLQEEPRLMPTFFLVMPPSED